MSDGARALLLASVGLVLALGGCGAGARKGDRIPGSTLTIYSSEPLHGASSVDARAVVGGARLALGQIGARIGRYTILFRPLDDATIQRARWDPGQTSDNARQAAIDPTTIGYIGELNSGASAVSIPLLNRAGIAQVSAGSTAVGLTSHAAGASPGEPQKYYPTGVRTYIRIVPDDAQQAAAQVKLQLGRGCNKTFVLDDGEVDGQDMATTFGLVARPAGLDVVGTEEFDPKAIDYSSLAQTVTASGANCILISAISESDAARVTSTIGAAIRSATIFGASGLAERTFTDPARGGIPRALDPRVLITVATLDQSAYPPAGRALLAAYAQRYGAPERYAIYGYEAMSLLLDAISRATHEGARSAARSTVVAALFATRNRHSALGTYSIDSNGDTTLRQFGVYRVASGRLEFWKAINR